MRILTVREIIRELYDHSKVDPDPNHEGIYLVGETKKGVIAQVVPDITGEKPLVFFRKEAKGYQLRIEREFEYAFSTLILYPKNVEHADIFSRSQVCEGGPNDDFPGSAAVLDIGFDYRNRRLELKYLQFCFSQGSPEELTRGLVSKYRGSSKHLLRFALDQVIDINLGCDILLSKRFLERGNNMRELNEVLSESQHSF